MQTTHHDLSPPSARSGRLSHSIQKQRSTSHESHTPPSLLRQKISSRSGSRHHRAQPTSFQNQSALRIQSGESSDDEVTAPHLPVHRLKLALPRSPMPSPSRPSSSNSGRNSGGRTKKRKHDRVRGERKSTVRKETYDIDSSSELTEEATDTDNQSKGPLHADDAAATSDSDLDMAAKLQAAGDGESLLGSAASEEENSVDEEEASYLIHETLQREAKARARSRREMYQHTGLGGHGRGGGPDWGLHGAGEQRGRASALHSGARLGLDVRGQESQSRRRQLARSAGKDSEEVMELDTDEEDNVNVEALSPDTLRTLGLPVLDDELFEEQEGFNSSSEPSFTDFFASDDDEDSDVFDLSPRSDDDVLTDGDDDDDDDDDDTVDDEDISDIDDDLLGTPYLTEVAEAEAALAASGGGMALTNGELLQAEIPLLVIEDLDGRLIYARAGDGEAVFGSDGEFEYLDDSEDEWSSDDDSTTALEIRDDDSGDTTDELPDENMPFPRLLVGSVAPRGGRAARRARAIAQQSRMLSPRRSRGRDASATAASEGSVAAQISNLPSPATTADDADTESDFNMVPDQSAAIGTSAVATPTTPTSKSSMLPSVSDQMPIATPVMSRDALLGDQPRPEMGQFMPASAKSIHRAVLDGSTKAPSPFANRRGTQSRGLSRKRASRRDSTSTDHSIKKARRLSLDGVADLNAAWGTETEAASEAPSSPGAAQRELADRAIQPGNGAPPSNSDVVEMDLDDVVNANMLWRGDRDDAETSSGDGQTHSDEDTEVAGAPDALNVRAQRRRASRASGKLQHVTASPTKRKRRLSTASTKKSQNAASSKATNSFVASADQPGLNFNAVARWDRIPMRAFVDTQSGGSHARSSSTDAQATRQPRPLGAFLLTGARATNAVGAHNGFSRGRGGARGSEHSPFRRSESAHNFSISMNMGVGATLMDDRTKSGDGNRMLLVSPVLFPTRNRSKSISTPAVEQNLQEDGPPVEGRTQMTRREKRERRARRQRRIEAIDLQRAIEASSTDGRTWAQAAGHVGGGKGKGKGKGGKKISGAVEGGKDKGKGREHGSNGHAKRGNEEISPPGSGPYSPATALPRLSITDASPRASPGVQAPPRRLPRREGSPSAKANDTDSAALVLSPLGKDSMSSVAPTNGSAVENLEGPAGNILPPSSSYGGVPLHSPLFGGISMYMAPSPTFGPRGSITGSPNNIGTGFSTPNSGGMGSKEREKREAEEVVELRI